MFQDLFLFFIFLFLVLTPVQDVRESRRSGVKGHRVMKTLKLK